jgi:pimeloyl-ACP methyl ester carboxylesterase
MKRIVFRWLKVIIIIYCLGGIAIYYLQNKIFFHPEPLDAGYHYQFDYPYKEVNIPYSNESVINVIQFTTADTLVKGVVLYFHGNRKNISWYARFAPTFTKHGYEVWMLDYPGYGKSTGAFTEKQLYDWSLTCYKLARARFAPAQIILYGKSLGSGIAAQLASVRDCRSLILETPYYSFPSILGSYLPVYPTQKMIHFKIPTWQYLQNVTAPVTIFHGTDDGTIRYRNAKRLQPFLKPGDQFVTIEDGSHNDLNTFRLYQEKVDSLLKN